MIKQPKYKVEIVDEKTETNYIFTGDRVKDVRTQLVDLYMEWKPEFNRRVLERLQVEKLIGKIEEEFGVSVTS
jgi:hypothetical protein